MQRLFYNIITYASLLMTQFTNTAVRHPVNQMVDGSGKDLISRINKSEKPPNQKVITGELVYRGLARIPK